MPHHQQSMPTPRPQQQGGGQFPNANRYTLVDTPGAPPPAGPGSAPNSRPGTGQGLAGSGSMGFNSARGRGRGGGGSGPGRGGAPGPMGDFGQGPPPPEEDPHDAVTTPGLGGGIVYAAKPGKGPTTFAEMGFQGAKAEDKDCVIM
jgi:hypothetical protein